MTIQYNNTHRVNDMTDVVTQAGASANLLIYSGSQPSSCASSATGTLLATIPCANPIGSVGSTGSSAGVLTFNTSGMTVSSGVVAGTAGYWRLVNGSTVIAQGSVGVSGSDINFSAGATFTSGQTISITGLTITAAGA